MYGGINLIVNRHQVYTETMRTFMTIQKLDNNQILAHRMLVLARKHRQIVLIVALIHNLQHQDLIHLRIHPDLEARLNQMFPALDHHNQVCLHSMLHQVHH